MSSIRKSSRTLQHNNTLQNSSAKSKSLKQQLLDECDYPRTGRRGAPQVFPRKLFQILEEVDEDVIGWTNKHGTSFTIYDMDYFTEHVLLNYFRHQKYSSFQRQLNLYGFHKICKGPETGAYAHDCFLRDKPELLMGVRRLPQRAAAAISKSVRLSQHRKSHKKVNNKLIIKRCFETQGKSSALTKLASCLKSRSARHHESSSECDSYSSNSEEGDEESSEAEEEDDVPPAPTFQSIVDTSIDNLTQNDEINTLEFFESSQESGEYSIDNLEQDGIIQFQPLPAECVLDSSSRIDGIAQGVNQLVLERSPMATAKTVKLPESSQKWSVKKLSPNNGLQRMIPMLVRAGSSAFAIGKEIKLGLEDDMMRNVIDDLENLDNVRSMSTTNTTRLIDASKDLMAPPPLNQRLSSAAWNMEMVNDQDLQQLFSNGDHFDSIFSRQESCDIVPPKPVEMER